MPWEEVYQARPPLTTIEHPLLVALSLQSSPKIATARPLPETGTGAKRSTRSAARSIDQTLPAFPENATVAPRADTASP